MTTGDGQGRSLADSTDRVASVATADAGALDLPLPGSGRTRDRWSALAAIAEHDLCVVGWPRRMWTLFAVDLTATVARLGTWSAVGMAGSDSLEVDVPDVAVEPVGGRAMTSTAPASGTARWRWPRAGRARRSGSPAPW